MAEKHTLFFIHGMGENDPIDEFERLWGEIRRAYVKRSGTTRADFDARFAPGFVDWHDVTLDAKLTIFREAFPDLEPQDRTALSLLRPIASARTFMTFFLGDVIAYVSENDNDIRRSVWAAMRGKLRGHGSYSIVAHSLGSVIAFDLVFNLYERGRLFWPVEDPEVDISDLQRRLHGLFTLGSPIGLFMLREGTLWGPDSGTGAESMFRTIRNPLPRGDQKWLNFWDEQDVISYPLERLFARNPEYNRGRPLEDVEVTTGWDPVSAHVNYWKDEGVARAIAAALP